MFRRRRLLLKLSQRPLLRRQLFADGRALFLPLLERLRGLIRRDIGIVRGLRFGHGFHRLARFPQTLRRRFVTVFGQIAPARKIRARPLRLAMRFLLRLLRADEDRGCLLPLLRRLHFSTERLELPRRRLGFRRTFRAFADALGDRRELRFFGATKFLELIHHRLQPLETVPENFHIEQRLEMFARLGRSRVEGQREPPLLHANQLRKKLRKSRAIIGTRDAAEEGFHFRITLRGDAAVAELHHFRAAAALQTEPALQPVRLAVVRKSNVDLARLLSGAQEIRRHLEVFLEDGIGEKKRVTQALDQRAFAVAVSSGDAVDAGLEGNGDPVPVRALAVRLDILQTDRADDHGSGFAKATRTLSTRGLARIVSASSCGERPRCTPSFSS